jgi:predicted membrane-bound mannosyltransferase
LPSKSYSFRQALIYKGVSEIIVKHAILTAVAVMAITGKGMGIRALRALSSNFLAKKMALITTARPGCVKGTVSTKLPETGCCHIAVVRVEHAEKERTYIFPLRGI